VVEKRIFDRPILTGLSGAYYKDGVKDIYGGVYIKGAGSLTISASEIITAMQIADQRLNGNFEVGGASARMRDRIAAIAIEYNIAVNDADIQQRMKQIRRWIDERKLELAAERGIKEVNPVPLPGQDEPIVISEQTPVAKERSRGVRDIVNDAADAVKQLVDDVSVVIENRKYLSDGFHRETRGARDIVDDVVAGMEDPMNDMADGIARNSEAIEKFLFGGRRRVTGGRGVNRQTRPEAPPVAQVQADDSAVKEAREREEQDEKERLARIQEEQDREQYFTELSLFPEDNSQDLAIVQAFEALERIRLERELTRDEQERHIEPLPEQYRSTLPNGRSVAEELAGDYPLSQNAIDNIDWDAKNFHGQTIADVRLQRMYEEGLERLRRRSPGNSKLRSHSRSSRKP
jgi:anti-sigma-K factor RskA